MTRYASIDELRQACSNDVRERNAALLGQPVSPQKPVKPAKYHNTRVEWDGEWFDLHGALRYAKSKYRRVINLSTFGDKFPIEQRFTGFQLDQYERGGMLNKFPLPLILNGAKNVFHERGAILLALILALVPHDH